VHTVSRPILESSAYLLSSKLPLGQAFVALVVALPVTVMEVIVVVVVLVAVVVIIIVVVVVVVVVV